MPVYVDNARHPFGRMLMCHMIADTRDELHGMAAQIGVARRHFQDKGAHAHYDICQSKRAAAVQAGAVEVTSRELVRILQRQQSGETGG